MLTSADKPKVIGTIGVCALDSKARSRPSRSILTRLQGNGEFDVVVFGDKAILDEGKHIPKPSVPVADQIHRRGKLACMVSTSLLWSLPQVRPMKTQSDA